MVEAEDTEGEVRVRGPLPLRVACSLHRSCKLCSSDNRTWLMCTSRRCVSPSRCCRQQEEEEDEDYEEEEEDDDGDDGEVSPTWGAACCAWPGRASAAESHLRC